MAPIVVPDTSDAVFVVTGGNRGLGLEHVKQFLEKTKVKVVATARQPNNADELNGLLKQHPGRLSVIWLDTVSEGSIEVLYCCVRLHLIANMSCQTALVFIKASARLRLPPRKSLSCTLKGST